MTTQSKKIAPSTRSFIGVLGLLAAGLCVTPAMASDAAHEAAMEQAEANYEAAKKHCDTMSGNTKDVCIKQAQATKVNAEANAKANRNHYETSKDAQQDKMYARYKLEKEKCDALSGDAQDACVERAKTNYMQ